MHSLRGRLNLHSPSSLMKRHAWKSQGNFYSILLMKECAWTGLTITKNLADRTRTSMPCSPCGGSTQMERGAAKREKPMHLTGTGNVSQSLIRRPGNRKSERTEERCGNVKPYRKMIGTQRIKRKNGENCGQIPSTGR